MTILSASPFFETPGTSGVSRISRTTVSGTVPSFLVLLRRHLMLMLMLMNGCTGKTCSCVVFVGAMCHVIYAHIYIVESVSSLVCMVSIILDEPSKEVNRYVLLE
ncbi:hypothetical protein BGY98DRAFT_162039 [Russula aff. rugulosa BPL654]|nr:hypothetical protein BGY98DRAFT_162039 [Russula aff. rugulosa BPL654]